MNLSLNFGNLHSCKFRRNRKKAVRKRVFFFQKNVGLWPEYALFGNQKNMLVKIG